MLGTFVGLAVLALVAVAGAGAGSFTIVFIDRRVSWGLLYTITRYKYSWEQWQFNGTSPLDTSVENGIRVEYETCMYWLAFVCDSWTWKEMKRWYSVWGVFTVHDHEIFRTMKIGHPNCSPNCYHAAPKQSEMIENKRSIFRCCQFSIFNIFIFWADTIG